tara:strand:- start:470 stop:955 length:486 start_codon:yes stop_codon:yes gene_type:complete
MIEAINKFCRLTKEEKEEVIYIKRSPSLIKAQKKYYEKNKEKITAKQTEYNQRYTKLTHTCDCGDVITNAARYHHLRSKRHSRRLENIKNGKLPSALKSEEKVDCACGGHYIFKHRHQHLKTKKHTDFILHQQQNLRKQLSNLNGSNAGLIINNTLKVKEI